MDLKIIRCGRIMWSRMIMSMSRLRMMRWLRRLRRLGRVRGDDGTGDRGRGCKRSGGAGRRRAAGTIAGAASSVDAWRVSHGCGAGWRAGDEAEAGVRVSAPEPREDCRGCVLS